jgi:methionyl-tRNA formyltransferase
MMRLKIAFIGCVNFSRALLETLLAIPDAEVCGVVTCRQSSINADFFDLTEIADKNGIPVFHVFSNGQDEIAAWIKGLGVDICFCFGWSYLLKSPVLTAAPLGVVGYHPTLLPRNRGRHPIIWSLALGLRETGSTFFMMDEGADSGPILSQERVAINATDDATCLYAKLTSIASHQLGILVAGLIDGSVVGMPQDPTQATFWRKRTKADGCIDWRMTAEGIHNLVRALRAPYPGAYCEYYGGDVKVWKTRLGNIGLRDIEPGYVLAINEAEITVQCGLGTTLVLEHHDFKKTLSVGGYL